MRGGGNITPGDPERAGPVAPPPPDLQALLYPELRRLARGVLRRSAPQATLQPTELVHEAWIRLAHRQGGDFEDRGHFLATAATVMRRVVVDHLRRRSAGKRGGFTTRVTLSEALAIGQGPSVDALDLDHALNRLAEIDPRKAEVVTCRVFAGLEIEEIAAAMAVSARTIERDWRAALAWLTVELGPRPKA